MNNELNDLDLLFDGLVAALQQAKDHPEVLAEAEALEARLFQAHDAVMAELAAAVRATGRPGIGYSAAVEALDAVYGDTVALLRMLAGGGVWGLA
ncbi:conserved protein of unknown function [Rhodovastum atsumiense]|uniref:DUF4404 family protein n=1 Tax=Rhodovastum atsumiense TaxID=504468 RepID=A0A5M6IT20_9PROT|nr:hypothetical protein [Rhodovastum atsumiense]KAA5610708.1 hypothetical protein F1189_18220 [Rhodovastum atsumiense]CAH2603290.1 conserved protein of unknown function [Rhodovastum atsumiense]